MDSVLSEITDCCGCGVCEQVCPTSAISIDCDKYGFKISQINTSLCINCGKCQKVCPSLNPMQDFKDYKNIVLSAFAKDEKKRNSGSSGGVFGLLAEYVLEKGGIVYGAAFDENLQLKHIEVTERTSLPRILKSKYLQSNIGNTFLAIKKQLSKGRLVLFCGTPCQSLALYNFLDRKKSDNLVIVDFICHGVPSQRFFDKSIDSYESRIHKKIKNFSFRYKNELDKTELGLRNWSLTTKDGLQYSGNSFKFPFYYAYLRYLFFRPSCYTCKYCRVERCTDITLGDFWGLRNIEKLTVREFNKGVSMLIVNSHKGAELIKKIEIITKEFPLQVAIENNYAYVHPTQQSDESKHFFEDYDKLSWNDLEKKYMIIKTDLFHRGYRFLRRIIKKW